MRKGTAERPVADRPRALLKSPGALPFGGRGTTVAYGPHTKAAAPQARVVLCHARNRPARTDLRPATDSRLTHTHTQVGICGRTGCGKSTLMMALYRIVEPCGGSVEIDGLDTGAIGLFDLRSRLALVPQEPVLFTGTIRSNLDPFGSAPGDHALWAALEQSGLKPTVAALEGGLDSPVTEGGANLSVGQRQLLCMARALLRQSRILLLDEATSNVDNETDAVIQRTIRTAFRDCTVLTIAHRLHTIADSDRILVLEQGRVAEYDAPDALLRREGGLYAALVGDAGGMRRSASGRTLTSPSVGAELNLLG